VTDILDQYFLNEYRVEIKAVEDVEDLSGELTRLFVAVFLKDIAAWPYELVSLARPDTPSKYTLLCTPIRRGTLGSVS